MCSNQAIVHLRFVCFIAYKFHIKIGKKNCTKQLNSINGILLEVFSKKCTYLWASQVALVGKKLPVNAGDVRDEGLIPGLGRYPGGGCGNSLLYSCLENPRTEQPGSYSLWGRRVGHD